MGVGVGISNLEWKGAEFTTTRVASLTSPVADQHAILSALESEVIGKS